VRHVLTDTKIRNAKPGKKPQKLSDGEGLFLLLNPNGSRWWRFRYRIHGREKMLSMGVYPTVTLKRAREKAHEARQSLDAGVDPSVKRKTEKMALAETFEAVAKEYFTMRAKKLAPQTIARDRERLEKYVFPGLGRTPVGILTAPDFLRVLRRVEARDTLDTVHRAKGACGRIMRYAVATGRADRDPTADLKGAFATRPVKHHAAITDPKRVGELLRAIHGYEGQPTTYAALNLAPLVFVRPGELRNAEWKEFDLEDKISIWRIPGKRMKKRESHLVPLSTQAVAILEHLRPITGAGRLVFPGIRSRQRPISDNTLNGALRRLGYTNDQMTAHGFRTMASTLLNEQGFHPDLIELQLAHAPANKVRAVYNRAERLIERTAMMQAWADYLGSLRNGDRLASLGRGKQ
jgi:integrase